MTTPACRRDEKGPSSRDHRKFVYHYYLDAEQGAEMPFQACDADMTLDLGSLPAVKHAKIPSARHVCFCVRAR